jgi:hypothetical protein
MLNVIMLSVIVPQKDQPQFYKTIYIVTLQITLHFVTIQIKA